MTVFYVRFVAFTVIYVLAFYADICNVTVAVGTNKTSYHISGFFFQPILYTAAMLVLPGPWVMRLTLWVCMIGVFLSALYVIGPLHAAWFNGRTRAHRAVFRGSDRVLGELGTSADALRMDNQGWTPLALAVARGRDDLAELLAQASQRDVAPNKGLAARCEAWREYSAGAQPFIAPTAWAKQQLKLPDVAEHVLPPPELAAKCFYGSKYLFAGGDINETEREPHRRSSACDTSDETGWHTLHQVVFLRQQIPVGVLAEWCGADAQDEQGWTPLHLAAYLGYPEIVNILLKRGADPAKRTADGQTAADLTTDPGTMQFLRERAKRLTRQR